MKSIITLLILVLFPIVGFSSIDEYKTDVYFANGIDTDEGNATANTLLLEKNIKEKIYKNSATEMNKYIAKVTESYNHTNGIVLDFWESLAQKLNFQELIDAIFDTSHERDLSKQVKAYENSIKDGHKVLVVAHSQGNLFTSEALNSLSSWMQDYFYVVSVASPKAFKIKDDTPHIAFDNDIVPWLGGVYVATDNPNDEAGSIESHAFTYYMGLPSAETNKTTDIAKIKIMNAIDGGFSKLDSLESQWNIDKSNKELLIKVIHKYDSKKVIVSEDVYPFNTAKKLYQVNGEYVKASCGGTKILDADKDDWENKKENEFYYLEGTGEIIKGGKCEFRVQLNDNDLAVYDKDTFFTVGRTYNQPYSSYKFNISYDNETKTYTASRHKTTTWVNSCGDKLQIGNGAGGRWIHKGINLSVQIAK